MNFESILPNFFFNFLILANERDLFVLNTLFPNTTNTQAYQKKNGKRN